VHLQILALIIQMPSGQCAQAQTNTVMPMENKHIHNYNFNMLSALKRKYKLFNVHIIMYLLREGFCPPYYFHERAFVRQVILREGFCPPCHFHGRAFVRLVIFTGGLLSALSLFDGRAFVREGFCPTLVFRLTNTDIRYLIHYCFTV
jgi:hypothetical protein